MAQEKRLRLELIADQTVTIDVVGSVTDQYRIEEDFAIADTDLRVLAESSISASGTLSLDLSGGGLTDPRGNAATFATVTQLVILHDSDSAASGITVGGNLADDIFGGAVDIPIEPGGCVVKCDPSGIAVVNTSADVIAITNADGANAAAVRVIIIGVSA